MGHREDLLAGAKRCLYEKGYARTTARDIVEASGANLASIGYHFRSKEALLNAALMEAVEEWAAELERALADAGADDPGAGPMERFERTWTRVVELFAVHRPLWVAQFDAISQIEHVPEVRAFFVQAQQKARRDLAALLQQGGGMPDAEAEAVGSFYHALLSGVMMQWVIDPEHAPSGSAVAAALSTITTRFAVDGDAAVFP